MPTREPHFKVHETISRHPKTVATWNSDTLLAVYVRVGVALVQHWAQRTDDHCVVSGRKLKEIAGCDQVSGAVQRMKRVSKATPVIFLDPRSPPDAAQIPSRVRPVLAQSQSSTPRVWVLGLRNFSKKQGFNSSIQSELKVSASANATATVEEERPDSPSPLSEPPVEARRLALLLGETARMSVPRCPLPKTLRQLRAWCVDLDRLHRLDGVPWEEIEATIRWLPTHTSGGDFRWGEQVLSAGTLRRQYARLEVARRSNGRGDREETPEERRARHRRMDEEAREAYEREKSRGVR